jgi:hypothetical protein
LGDEEGKPCGSRNSSAADHEWLYVLKP